MITKIKFISYILLAAVIGFSSCKKTEYSFGELKTPSSLALTAVVAGVDATNPNGNGTGSITVTIAAQDAITYKVDFGDGNFLMVPSGTVTYKYANPGTFDYTVTVNAVGTGGTSSTISKKIKVWVNFTIPAEILTALTNNASKTWIANSTEPGVFGIGPADGFTPSWWAAGANDEAKTPAYDDEITFTKDVLGNVSMKVDNKGISFIIGAALPFYGFSGAEGGFPLVTGTDAKKLVFMGATSTSTPDVSTRIQFTVPLDSPGKGIILFGTGGNTYEILSATPTLIHLRNIGADGNAWYMKLKPKQ